MRKAVCIPFAFFAGLSVLFGLLPVFVVAQSEVSPSEVSPSEPAGMAQSASFFKLQEFADLSYRGASETDTNQRLNLVLPVGVEPPPLLVWIGGGAWSYVNRNMEMDLARKVAREGIAVASVGHRLSTAVFVDPERTEGVQHPAHVKDVAAAFDWLHGQAEKYGYDAERIFVGGFSSGGHLAALLSVDPQYLGAYDLEIGDIEGVIPIAGTYDVADYREAFVGSTRPHLVEQHVEAVFGSTPEGWREASPTSFLENLQVPMLLISENQSFNYTRILEDAIRETEFRDLVVMHLHKIGHAGLWQDMSHQEESVYRDYLVRFILEG